MAIEKKTALIKEHRVWCTYALTALLVYVYACERHALAWGILGPLLDDYAFQWTAFLSNPWGAAPQLITYTFLHANESHLIGNLIFFLFFARAVERVVGGFNFAGLFLVSGAVAALTNGYFEPFVTAHLIGASGAISRVMGAYFVLFPLKTCPSRATESIISDLFFRKTFRRSRLDRPVVSGQSEKRFPRVVAGTRRWEMWNQSRIGRTPAGSYSEGCRSLPVILKE